MLQRRHNGTVSSLVRSSIRDLVLFREMADDEIDELLRSARQIRIPKNRAVFHQGDHARHFYCLLQGHLRVVQLTPDGQQIVVRIVNPGELFGVAKALRRKDYPGTAYAAVNCEALAWRSCVWDTMMCRCPTLVEAALHTVGRNLQDAHARIRELSTENVERRVAHTLVRLAAQAGYPTNDGVLIDFPISQQDLAEMTGTTVFSINRLFRTWETAGLLSRGRQRLLVHDPSRMQALADEGAGRPGR